jgi:NAD+ synthase (glutamine-hydrolysing)
MCRLVVEACNAGDEQVLKDVRMVCADGAYSPKSPQEFCNRIFHTCFMGSTNSSGETQSRARDLSKAIGGR